MKIREIIDELRVGAKCRCNAIAKKVLWRYPGPMPEEFQPCCWVCCDCSIDRYEDDEE